MKLAIIIGSTRQGRVSDRLARWVKHEAEKKPGFDATILDLRDYDLPFFDEALPPQYNQNRETSGGVKKWLNDLEEQDAYIIVTPEYNRSIPGVLKNAIDYIGYEIKGKPVGIATHGSTNGAQAVAHLRGIIPGALGFTVPTFVGFGYAEMLEFGQDGTPGESMIAARESVVEAMLHELADFKK